MILLSVIVLATFLFTRNEVRSPNKYKATVQVLIPARDEKGNRPPDVPPVLLQGQETLALSGKTTGAALKAARFNRDQASSVRFGVKKSEGGDIITVSATARDVLTATAGAEALADSYIDARGDIVASATKGEQAGARTALTTLRKRLSEVNTGLARRRLPRAALLALADRPTTATNTGSKSTTTTAAPLIDLPDNLALDTVLLVYEHVSLKSRISETQKSYADAAASALTPKSYATIVERPPPSQITPPPPSPLLPSAAILAIGLLLAVAVPVLIDRTDHTIRDARSAGAAFGAPVLTAIPAVSRSKVATLAAPGTARDGAFRSLAATCVATDRLPRAIMVTSPVGSIQDTVAANFAAALASMGLRVLLVATATRQSWFLNDSASVAPDAITLPEMLERAHTGRLNGEVPNRLAATDLANLMVVPAGATDDLQLALDGLPPLLDALATSQIDVTVIAGPAFLEDPNATIFAWATRSVLWAVETGEVTEEQAREAASRLVLAGVTPFGVAMVSKEA